MCGIAGIFATERDRPLDEAGMKLALNAMRARGPDAEGTYRRPGILLGHRRLAILDPAHAAQPWADPGHNHVITYNGEVYNYRELRRERLDTAALASNGDTAVLSAMLGTHGLASLEHLRGMFAFGWYEREPHRLTLVRDPLGIKPLYYCFNDGLLNFASSIPALLALSGIERHLDGIALTHYLATARTHIGARTLIQGIYALQPGEFFQIDGSTRQPQTRKYWEAPKLAENEKCPPSWEQAVDDCRNSVESVVRQQMVSDVPLGSFLSGGLDSSIIAGSVARQQQQNLFGYNVGYEREHYNEWPYVRELAAANGIDCELISLGRHDSWEDLEDLIELKGMPLSTPNEMAIRKLAQAFTRKGTVALSGEGADEIFGGYVLPQLGALDYDRSRKAGTADRLHAALAAIYGQSRFRSRAQHFLLLNSWTRKAERERWLKADFRSHWQAEEVLLESYEKAFDPLQHCSTVEAYLHMHTRTNLEGLLERVDSSTMAASVEARVPFTDHKLVEWAFQLPDHWKIRFKPDSPLGTGETVFHGFREGRSESKRILRAAFADQIPACIRDRQKFSFPTPFQESIQNEWSQRVRVLLDESPLVASIVSPSTSVLTQSGMAAWLWLNLAVWAEKWQVS